MGQGIVTKQNSLFARPLASVFWLEAPSISIVVIIVSYGLKLSLETLGVAESILNNLHLFFIGLAVTLGNGYIWLTSKNTSKVIYTFLSRTTVLINFCVYILMVIASLK